MGVVDDDGDDDEDDDGLSTSADNCWHVDGGGSQPRLHSRRWKSRPIQPGSISKGSPNGNRCVLSKARQLCPFLPDIFRHLQMFLMIHLRLANIRQNYNSRAPVGPAQKVANEFHLESCRQYTLPVAGLQLSNTPSHSPFLDLNCFNVIQHNSTHTVVSARKQESNTSQSCTNTHNQSRPYLLQLPAGIEDTSVPPQAQKLRKLLKCPDDLWRTIFETELHILLLYQIL